MGCYDTILLPCPKCGEIYEAQSKSGECLLHVYKFKDAPQAVMENVNRHAPFLCSKCGAVFHVKFIPEIKIIETNDIMGTPLPSSAFFVFPESASSSDAANAFAKFADAIAKYQSKLDKK